MDEISIRTSLHSEFINISKDISNVIPLGFNGVCHIFCKHTTAGLTINENADPDVIHDLLKDLDRLVPWANTYYMHSEGNSAAHLKSSFMGVSLTVPIVAGKLEVGIWQGIYFCEFDGPRKRSIFVQFQKC